MIRWTHDDQVFMPSRVSLTILAFAAFLTGCTDRRAAIPAENIQTTFVSPVSGFRFQIPSSWHQSYRIETPEPATNSPPANEVVEFQYVPRDSTIRPPILLRIVVFAKRDWASLADSQGPPYGWSLEEREGMVWVGGLPQSNPFAPGSEDANRFETMRLSEQQVEAAFRVP